GGARARPRAGGKPRPTCGPPLPRGAGLVPAPGPGASPGLPIAKRNASAQTAEAWSLTCLGRCPVPGITLPPLLSAAKRDYHRAGGAPPDREEIAEGSRDVDLWPVPADPGEVSHDRRGLSAARPR